MDKKTFENIIICDKLHDVFIIRDNKLISLCSINESGYDDFDEIQDKAEKYLITNELVDRILNNTNYVNTMLNKYNPRPTNISSTDEWYTQCVKDMIIFILNMCKTKIKISKLINLFFDIIENCVVTDINKFFPFTCDDIVTSMYENEHIKKIIITDDIKLNGYIHLDNCWSKMNKNEPLDGWIDRWYDLPDFYEKIFGNIMDDAYIKRLMSEHKLGRIIKNKQLSKLMNITNLGRYDYLMQITIQILLNVCYDPLFKIDPLESHEFIFWHDDKCILIDTKNGTNTDVTNQIQTVNRGMEYIPNLTLEYAENHNLTFIIDLLDKWLADATIFIGIFRSIFFNLGKVIRINIMNSMYHTYVVRELIGHVCYKLNIIYNPDDVDNISPKNKKRLVIFDTEPGELIKKYKDHKFTIIINDKEKDVFENPDVLSEYAEYHEQEYVDLFLERVHFREIVMYIFENV